MKSRFKMHRTFAVALSIVSLSVLAGCKDRSPEARIIHVAEKTAKKLDLNATQKAELDKLAAEALADFRSMRPERKAGADLVEKQLTSEKIDRASLKQFASQQQAKREALYDKWIDKIANFYESLTPKQKSEALKHFKKFRSKFHDKG